MNNYQTPHNLDQAIRNALAEIGFVADQPRLVEVIHAHVKDYLANVMGTSMLLNELAEQSWQRIFPAPSIEEASEGTYLK